MGKDVACTDRLVVLLNSPRFKKHFHKAFVQMPDTLAGLCTDFLVSYTSANSLADVCVACFWMESGQRRYYSARAKVTLRRSHQHAFVQLQL